MSIIHLFIAIWQHSWKPVISFLTFRFNGNLSSSSETESNASTLKSLRYAILLLHREKILLWQSLNHAHVVQEHLLVGGS